MRSSVTALKNTVYLTKMVLVAEFVEQRIFLYASVTKHDIV